MKAEPERSVVEPFLFIIAAVYFAGIRLHYTPHITLISAGRIICEAYLLLSITFMAMYLKEWAEVFTESNLGKHTESRLSELKQAAKNSLFMYNTCLVCGFVAGIVYFLSYLF
jgi:hypothetical protein